MRDRPAPPPARPDRTGQPGWGRPHPGLDALLARVPDAVDDVRWPGGVRLRAAAYVGGVAVPEELVTSVRCLVRVGGRLLVCEAPDATHVWPGGRRDDGETFAATACREVLEETGWVVDEGSLVPLGFVHYRYADPQPAGHPYPHPDFVQLVYAATASRHAGDPARWVDVDGWERGRRLADPAEVAGLALPATQRAFVAALPAG